MRARHRETFASSRYGPRHSEGSGRPINSGYPSRPRSQGGNVKRWVVAFCAATVSASAIPAQVPPATRDIPSIAAAARGAVVLLKVFASDGSLRGVGSGFRVAGGRLVTNAHVVAGAARVEVFDDNGNLLGVAHYADMLS